MGDTSPLQARMEPFRYCKQGEKEMPAGEEDHEMADQQYLDLLFRRAGAETFEQVVHLWNLWRQRHPGVHIDFSDEDLTGGDFTGIDFSHVDVRRAYLYDTCFKGADLRGASLQEANLGLNGLENVDL